MLGSACCCKKRCDASNSGDSSAENAYVMPSEGGFVNFEMESLWFKAYIGVTNFTVFNTDRPNQVFLRKEISELDGIVNINFWKPVGVTSVTVKVTTQEAGWNYKIGCPRQLSCLQQKCGSQVDGYPETIIVTITVPSYKLTIPRIGKEYWYQTWREYNRFNGWQTVTKPWALPLDVKLPKPMRYQYKDYWTQETVTAIGAVYSPFANWIDEWSEDTYVRPDELPEDPEDGYFSGTWSSADAFHRYRSFWGKWEYVGKYEFSAEYELDGSFWSGTYELQKVEGLDDTWIYYFPEGEPPACNIQTDGFPPTNLNDSYILLQGCRISLGNLKAKVTYGLGEATGLCDDPDVAFDWSKFNLSGYSPISWISGVGWFVSGIRRSHASTLLGCDEPPAGPLNLIPHVCNNQEDESLDSFRFTPSSPPPLYNTNTSLTMEATKLTAITAGFSNYVGNGLERILFIPLVDDVDSLPLAVSANYSPLARKISAATGKGMYQFVDPEWLTRVGQPDTVLFDRGPALPWFPEYIKFAFPIKADDEDFPPGGVIFPGQYGYEFRFDPYYEESGKIPWDPIYSGSVIYSTTRCGGADVGVNLDENAVPNCKWCGNSWYKDNGYWIESWEGDLAVQIDSFSFNYIED